MSVFYGAAAMSGGMVGTSHAQASAGMEGWQVSGGQHLDTSDAMETYFECITTCSLEDGECVTRCVEQLREMS